jgi:M6 family metalloprotease-like protein
MPPEMIQQLQSKGVLRKAGELGLKNWGVKKIIVVRVQFPDGLAMSASKPDTEAFFQKLQEFYKENSYGLLTTSATVSNTVYQLSNIYNYDHETDADLIRLKNDTLAAVTANPNGINFANYDYMMIYHAGYGEEESYDSSDLWSMFYGLVFTTGTKTFDGFTVVPELSVSGSSPLGVICHEFGHQLGLPDLYNTSVAGGKSVCGAWSLMDYPYGYDNTGSRPPHLDPWCKNFLGFIDLSSRVVNSSIPQGQLGDIETSQSTGFYKLPVAVGGALEYFITEYRMPDPAKAKYDKSLPGTGVLIWHIDDSIASSTAHLADNDINNDSSHPAVGLVTADNKYIFPPGDAGNAFSPGDVFTSPQSNAFNGKTSDVTITNFIFSGDVASINLRKIAMADVVGVNKLISYPNPAGNGYPHPRSGVLATIVLQATRPPKDISMTIYDLAGEKVGAAKNNQFNLKLDASSDLHWVYEYDWDGKNESGESVAPGIYFVRIKADSDMKVGKLAIVR